MGIKSLQRIYCAAMRFVYWFLTEFDREQRRG